MYPMAYYQCVPRLRTPSPYYQCVPRLRTPSAYYQGGTQVRTPSRTTRCYPVYCPHPVLPVCRSFYPNAKVSRIDANLDRILK